MSAIADKLPATTVATPATRAGARLEHFIWKSLLCLPVLVALPYGAAEIWWQTLFECLVFGLTALWLMTGHRRVVAADVLGPGLLLAALGLAQAHLLPSADPFESQRFAFRVAALVLYTGLLLSYLTSARRMRNLALALTGLGAACALFGIIRHTAQQTTGFILPALPVDGGFAQFINRNHFAFLMEMALGLAAGIALGGGTRRRWELWFFVAAAAITGVALAWSKSRGGILACLGQAVVLGLLVWEVRRPAAQESGSRVRRAAGVCGLALTVALALFWVGGDMLTQRFANTREDLSLAGETRDNTRRVDIWRATLPMIAANPLTGQGLGGYWIALPQYHDASGDYVPRQAHNDYLELLASGGLVGVALFAWFARGLAQRARARLRSRDPWRRAVCLGAVTGLAGVAIHSLVDFGLHITANAVFAAALVALAVAPGARDE